MDYKELFINALNSLRNNILRTSLTMLGIIIGISSVILIVSIGKGAEKFIVQELSSFGTNYFSINPGQNQFTAFAGGVEELTLDDVEAIQDDESLSNIQTVMAFASTNTKVSANDINKNILIQGTPANGIEILNPEMIYGEFISEINDLESDRVTVIGIETAEEFFGEDTNPVGEKIQIGNKSFTVIGVAKSSSVLSAGIFDKSLFIPLNVILNQFENTRIQEIDVLVNNTDYMNQTIADVELLMRDRHNLEEGDESDFSITSATDALSIVETITGLLTLMIATISGISLVVGGVGVMNIMLVSVTERTKEIGLLKAIGALERDILMQFLIESVVMSVIGGIIGILLGISGAYLVSLVAGIPFVVSFGAVAMAVGVSMGVGIVFGLYPAKRAARLSPIDALRYE